MAAFPLGVALAAIEMQEPVLARAVPIAVGVVVLIRRRPPAHRVEGASPCLLPGGTRTRPYAAAPAPARHGGTACASASTAATAVRSDGDAPWSSGSWTSPAMAVVAAASPSNVSHRPGERVAE